MKSLFIERLAFKAATVGVIFAFIVSGSLVTLAASTKPVGEIMVTGAKVDGASVTVNGEPADTGRTIFSSSTISTPEGTSALINLGKAGRIQLAPGSTFVINVEDNAVKGNLTAGSLTVLNSAQPVGVKTLTGDVVTLSSGETASASSGSSSKKAKPGPGGLDWWVWAAIIGGATAAVIIFATRDDNNTTSPVR
ncbi:MAG TPA: hypothetical protein PLP21_07695 [Pyrinomonadaceae bacterium]|nr:hypothetical protein [Acidobacteriota bacterium]HQZ96188.1 hypothetical protein [Pyrinomonadaceae bacterium]